MNKDIMRIRRLGETLEHMRRCAKGQQKEAVNERRRERKADGLSGRQRRRKRSEKLRVAKHARRA